MLDRSYKFFAILVAIAGFLYYANMGYEGLYKKLSLENDLLDKKFNGYWTTNIEYCIGCSWQNLDITIDLYVKDALLSGSLNLSGVSKNAKNQDVDISETSKLAYYLITSSRLIEGTRNGLVINIIVYDYVDGKKTILGEITGRLEGSVIIVTKHNLPYNKLPETFSFYR